MLFRDNGNYFEEDKQYEALLKTSNESVTGHRYFNSDGIFIGLYNRKNGIIWKIRLETLKRVK